MTSPEQMAEKIYAESFWNLMHFYPIKLSEHSDIIGRELVIELEKVVEKARRSAFEEVLKWINNGETCDVNGCSHYDLGTCIENKIRALLPPKEGQK